MYNVLDLRNRKERELEERTVSEDVPETLLTDSRGHSSVGSSVPLKTRNSSMAWQNSLELAVTLTLLLISVVTLGLGLLLCKTKIIE